MSCKEPNVIEYWTNTIYLKDQNKETEQPKGTKIRIISPKSQEFKGYEYYLDQDKKIKLKESYEYWGDLDSNHPVKLPKYTEHGYKLVPCRHCIGCKLKETKEWALRIELESKQYEHNYFITLTYNDENLPMKEYSINEKTGEKYTPEDFSYNWKGTLYKPHTQQFLKSLRQYFKREFNHEGCKFYLAGEYGTLGERPHYHLILLNTPELELKPIGMNTKTGHPYYINERIEKIWGKGFITIGEVTWDSISYTAGYCQKKLYGDIGQEIYAIKGQEPIFANMSRRPGIGRSYFNLYEKEIYKNDEIINSKGQSVKPPSYFDRLENDIGEEDYLKELKRIRSEYAQNELKKKMLKTNVTIQEQLQIEKRTLEEKQKYYNRERI